MTGEPPPALPALATDELGPLDASDPFDVLDVLDALELLDTLDSLDVLDVLDKGEKLEEVHAVDALDDVAPPVLEDALTPPPWPATSSRGWTSPKSAPTRRLHPPAHKTIPSAIAPLVRLKFALATIRIPS
jgi:hypothetical protein